jgi:glycosyltransferase involved in cell wall biosynthesis
MHSSLPRQLARIRGWNSWPVLALSRVLERWAVGSADAVIVVSEGLEQIARTISPKARIKTIENVPLGLSNTTRNRPSVDSLRVRLDVQGRVPIVYTGTLEPYQGIDLLLDSAPAVIESCPIAIFLLVGGTDGQVEGWRRELDMRGLADHVRLVGRVPLEQISDYLELAEILVSPRRATMPVPSKIYFYMEAGKPIVATDVDSHTQVLQDDAAVLVKPTSEALSQALVSLIEAPELRQELCDNVARLYRRSYSPEMYLAGLREVYGRLLDEGESCAASVGSLR